MSYRGTCSESSDVWWHLYPLGFCGAPIRELDLAPRPRLRTLLNWVEYINSLGATGLILGPVFNSESHGYDTLDHFSVDPRLGGNQDLADIIDTCHRHGIKIILDGVFSHVGARHSLLLQALKNGKKSFEAKFFDIDWDSPEGPNPAVFEGHRSLARLNHSSVHVKNYVATVMNYWLEQGIDGWRLDAVYSVPSEFWSEVLTLVRGRYPDAWLMGEVIHGDYAKYVQETTIDSVTQYQLWKAIWSSFLDRNLFELDWSFKRHNAFLSTFVPHTFIGNHDVTRIARTLGEQGSIDAMAILLTLGGSPSIYAGDELGYKGTKEQRIGGDDAIRPAFPDEPSQLSFPNDSYSAYQKLIRLRHAHPWLQTSTTETLSLENTRMKYRSWSQDRSTYIDTTVDLDSAPAVSITNNHQELLWSEAGSGGTVLGSV